MSHLNGERILIVEDDPTNRTALARLLATEAASVESAASVVEAIRAIDRAAPRAVLLDVNLPDGEGIEVLHHLNSRGLAPKVLIITGSMEPGRHRDYQAAGARAILTKPVTLNQILGCLNGSPHL